MLSPRLQFGASAYVFDVRQLVAEERYEDINGIAEIIERVSTFEGERKWRRLQRDKNGQPKQGPDGLKLLETVVRRFRKHPWIGPLPVGKPKLFYDKTTGKPAFLAFCYELDKSRNDTLVTKDKPYRYFKSIVLGKVNAVLRAVIFRDLPCQWDSVIEPAKTIPELEKELGNQITRLTRGRNDTIDLYEKPYVPVKDVDKATGKYSGGPEIAKPLFRQMMDVLNEIIMLQNQGQVEQANQAIERMKKLWAERKPKPAGE